MMMEEEMQKKATIKLYEERQGVIQSAMTRYVRLVSDNRILYTNST